MRLIKCATLEFEEHVGTKKPPYAILSHTWGSEEVLFEDFSCKDMNKRKGRLKVLETCRLALRDEYQYAWIDTRCIDKSSSAELTEAINSMFNWYSQSSQCYVYLNDFDSKGSASDLTACRWFTRGWTLQELIAPSDIRDLSREKDALGSSSGNNARRGLTYCLLGIFSISMPLVYGEGARAFTRLQEEIIKETNDLTLFAWQAEAGMVEKAAYRGVLATSPKEFAYAGTIVSSTNPKNNPEFAMTNKGLKIRTRLSHGPGNSVLMSLNCH